MKTDQLYIIYTAINTLTKQIPSSAAFINNPLCDYLCNSKPEWKGSTCWIVAITDIDPYEELLMAYGSDYWIRKCIDIVTYSLIKNKARANYCFKVEIL